MCYTWVWNYCTYYPKKLFSVYASIKRILRIHGISGDSQIKIFFIGLTSSTVSGKLIGYPEKKIIKNVYNIVEFFPF